jgi:hypothetical protein
MLYEHGQFGMLQTPFVLNADHVTSYETIQILLVAGFNIGTNTL